MQRVIKLHQGSLCAKLAFGQVSSPQLNPPSEGSASVHRAPRGVTTTAQLPAGRQLTAKGKHLLEEAHKLFLGKMSAGSVREAPLHHELKRASDAYILGMLLDMLLAGKEVQCPQLCSLSLSSLLKANWTFLEK